MVFLPTHWKHHAMHQQRDASKSYVRAHVPRAQRKLTRIQKIQRNRYLHSDLCRSVTATMMRAYWTRLAKIFRNEPFQKLHKTHSSERCPCPACQDKTAIPILIDRHQQVRRDWISHGYYHWVLHVAFVDSGDAKSHCARFRNDCYEYLRVVRVAMIAETRHL